ncbi:asparaginyl-tRNA synthetase [Coniothyrium glycines]
MNWLRPVPRTISRARSAIAGRRIASPSCIRYTSTRHPASIAELLRPSLSASNTPDTPKEGSSLTISGYVRTIRKQKRVAFAAIGDGSTLQTVQAVLAPQLADGLSTGAAVTITGQWSTSLGQGQSFELQVTDVQVLGDNDATTYPIQKKYQTPEFLRTKPHLRSRLPFNSLLLRLRSLVTAQVTSYFAQQDFVQCHPPIITSSDCEGAGEVFTVAPEAPATKDQITSGKMQPHEDAFFGSTKYLTVSSQLHLEALAQSVNKVWTLSPTFRAERSDTARHLSEFYMLEAELAFVDDVNKVMDVVEDMLRAVTIKLQTSDIGRELLDVKERNPEQDSTSVTREVLAQRWQGLTAGPWPRITYDAAIQHLQGAVAQGQVQFDFAPNHDAGLQTEHERFLADSVGQGGPVFVTDYPRNIKPFYMAPSKDSALSTHTMPTVACFDLLVPELCELAGGSMREHRLQELLHSMKAHNLQHATQAGGETPEGSLEWYVDLRRYGSVPHGGFGLGFDRLLCYLSGVSNIRDVVNFPRWHKRCDC